MKKKGSIKNIEILLEKKKRAVKILSLLEDEYPEAKCHLNFDGPFELLIGCILSAQCTDKRVNEVTPGLFKKYPTPFEFSKADQSELEQEIHSCGFYRAKTKSIINCSKALVEEHDGEVPRTMDELTKLAGVGRKTANVVLGNYFGIPGIIVDTHIKRLSTRLGLTTNSDPTKIEYDLNELMPQKKWTIFSNSLGDHGRTVCHARKPLCGDCIISLLCPSAGLV
ncbi:MAG: endonuclease III [Thermodesulfobacteriota bacterium]|nr:MAG: endonuclease III [Thermodesulfobacteriota bacterium]